MMNDSSSSMNSGATARGGRFFRTIDWAAFWTGTLVSFAVYFFTASPTVTMEDAGELAVAGDHLGVPHPPGYPIWTMCAWVFARVLGFVTFRGQPTPAWSIAVMSGFFGALAAGLTAMLVTRTASDIIKSNKEGGIRGDGTEGEGRGGDGATARGEVFGEARVGGVSLTEAACFAAGVAAALVFAFSPVMWSQSTIVEVYSLNSFFLMLVFVLTYRWMRSPSDKLLWVTAFVFGLGLTNYQVLLLAIIPLVFVIMVHDIELFRDFALAVIPFGLTAGMMKLGANISQPGFPKHELVNKLDGVDIATRSAVVAQSWYAWAIVIGLVFVAAAVCAGVLARRKAARSLSAEGAQLYAAAAGAAAVAGAALLVVCSSVPSAPVPPGWENLSVIPPEQVFSWTAPMLAFFAAIGALFVLALFVPGGLWYAVAIAGIECAVAIFIRKGALLGLTHPLSGAFAFYVALNFIVLAVIWLLLPSGRTVSLSVLAAELGVAFYGYMPISSDTNPPMNWGYPRTWEGFKHAIMRGQYEKISPQDIFSPTFVKVIGAYFADVRMQFTLILAPFGFVPFAVWRARAGGVKIRAVTVATWLSILTAAVVAFDKVTPAFSLEGLRVIDKGLVAIVLACASLGVLAIIIRQITTFVRSAFDPASGASARLVSGLCGAGLAAMVLGMAAKFCHPVALAMLGAPAGGAVSAALAFLLFAMFAALCGIIAWLLAAKRDWFDIEIDDDAQRWHIATVSCFLVMSLGLIALANPKYDVQDNFIQKVKFIASHGIFAIWIGYGLVYAIQAVVRPLLKRGDASSSSSSSSAASSSSSSAAAAGSGSGTGSGTGSPAAGAVALAALLAVSLTPLIPIHENYRNDKLVQEMGGAEQDGHDFGWQFGNYQLRGAAAITEELEPDEEPLPNPSYPPEMTPSAVFYGGTDPGRFVPTYMIYSARVRPDVYLITQNALADNTYLDTMRFLYADDIWMPTLEDNSTAFQQYVDDVRAGRRPNLGGISFDGGRVQVNGALAVMEINGIITKQIFDKNKARHDFYVEESYAIQWMYPYLTPHGLIMKINPATTSYRADSKTVSDDMDFWDWYTRRLLADPKFPRDFAARKAFSKLRNAIGGAHVHRGLHAQAERAYQEARALCLYSPESNIRLIQDVLMRQSRFDESVEILELLKVIDPNNDRIPLKEVTAIRDAARRLAELSAKQTAGEPLTDAEVLDYVEKAFTAGARQQGIMTAQAYAARPGAAPAKLQKMALLAANNNATAEASKLLEKTSIPALAATAELPSDWQSAYPPPKTKKQRERAEKERQEASDHQRRQTADTLRRIAEIHGEAQNYPPLRDALRAYVILMPGDWETCVDYARVCLMLKDQKGAAGALSLLTKQGGPALTGLPITPRNWQSATSLAQISLALGDQATARAALEQALRHGGAEAASVISQTKSFQSLFGPRAPAPAGAGAGGLLAPPKK